MPTSMPPEALRSARVGFQTFGRGRISAFANICLSEGIWLFGWQHARRCHLNTASLL